MTVSNQFCRDTPFPHEHQDVVQKLLSMPRKNRTLFPWKLCGIPKTKYTASGHRRQQLIERSALVSGSQAGFFCAFSSGCLEGQDKSEQTSTENFLSFEYTTLHKWNPFQGYPHSLGTYLPSREPFIVKPQTIRLLPVKASFVAPTTSLWSILFDYGQSLSHKGPWGLQNSFARYHKKPPQ